MQTLTEILDTIAQLPLDITVKISLAATSHAKERQRQRNITNEQILSIAKSAMDDIGKDYFYNRIKLSKTIFAIHGVKDDIMLICSLNFDKQDNTKKLMLLIITAYYINEEKLPNMRTYKV